MSNSYLSPALEVRTVFNDQYGLFATRPIAKGEILTIWGGLVYPMADFRALPSEIRERSLQIESEFFLVPHQIEDADFVNHSCNPNAGVQGQSMLIAMRDIATGEEICFDYAMTDSCDYDEFECQCGSVNCRGKVTGDDWRIPELQERYQGYFSAYLQRRINEEEAQRAKSLLNGTHPNKKA